MRFGSLTLAIVFGVASLAHAAASPGPWSAALDGRTTAEQRLLLDAADGALDEHELLQATLIAGGIDDARAATATAQRFIAWQARLDATVLPDDSRERAAAIFTRLHGDLLGGEYQTTCSDVSTALETGDFNCLSATILYVCAARHCGLNAQPLATDGHVLCEIVAENGTFEVETTCPTWFTLTHADAQNAKQARLAPQADGASHEREVRRLSDVELLAKVYYNRGVAALRASDYVGGLKLTRTSLRLDPRDAVARGNELAGLNNWALALCRAGDAMRAAEVLAELRELDPQYPTLDENAAHIERSKAAIAAQ